MLPPAGRRCVAHARWIVTVYLLSALCLPIAAQPTVNGLFLGDGDYLKYSPVAVAPLGRGVLYAAVDDGMAYALLRVDTTANDNAFGICKNHVGVDCAMMESIGWDGPSKEHTYEKLWNSEYSEWQISCLDVSNPHKSHTWTWRQGYMDPVVGSSCHKDTDPDGCQGKWESRTVQGTPPSGTSMATSMVYNMNHYNPAKWDATVGGTRTDGSMYRSDGNLTGYPGYSAALDYAWEMIYEISFPIPASCDPSTLTRSITGAHHSPDKDGGGDIIIIPEYDLGDNPDSYGTLVASGGPRHAIVPSTVVLGAIVDAETDGSPSADSQGDDGTGSDDEDGVLFPGLGQNECPIDDPMPLTISYTSGNTNVWLDAFADWDGDGVYDLPDEKIIEGNLFDADTAGSGIADGMAVFDIPCQPTGGQVKDDPLYLRFRVHLGSSPLGPTGDAPNGEVEDYLATYTGGPPIILPVELEDFVAVSDRKDVVLNWATASETNNAGFYIEQGAGDEYNTLGFVEGAGTTAERHDYSYRVNDVDPGTHRFRLRQVDFDGAFEYSPVVEVKVQVPGRFILEPAYPNPFNPQSSIRFAVERSETVTLDLFDVTGRIVQTLYKGVPEANEMVSVTLDGEGLSSGIYLVRLSGTDFAATQTVTLLK